MNILGKNCFQYKNTILAKVLKYLNATEIDSAIDVGCDDGSYKDFLLQKANNFVGIDIKKSKTWKNFDKYSFSVASICDMPFRDESFDLVFEKDVLHHITNPKKALKELFRVAKTNGYIVCIEANRYNPLFFFHATLLEGHDHFTKKFFMKLINIHSKDVKFFSVESHLYPIKNEKILNKLRYIENAIEKFEVFNDYLNFNIAIIKK